MEPLRRSTNSTSQTGLNLDLQSQSAPSVNQQTYARHIQLKEVTEKINFSIVVCSVPCSPIAYMKSFFLVQALLCVMVIYQCTIFGYEFSIDPIKDSPSFKVLIPFIVYDILLILQLVMNIVTFVNLKDSQEKELFKTKIAEFFIKYMNILGLCISSAILVLFIFCYFIDGGELIAREELDLGFFMLGVSQLMYLLVIFSQLRAQARLVIAKKLQKFKGSDDGFVYTVDLADINN